MGKATNNRYKIVTKRDYTADQKKVFHKIEKPKPPPKRSKY
jgi:hypothetical protein